MVAVAEKVKQATEFDGGINTVVHGCGGGEGGEAIHRCGQVVLCKDGVSYATDSGVLAEPCISQAWLTPLARQQNVTSLH